MSLMSDLGTAVKSKLDLKQDTVIAGSNITIDVDGKTVNAVVPSSVSELTNDSGYQTSTQVNSAIQAVVGAAPAALDTLKEIADQLADDEDAVSALTTVVSNKVDKVTGKGLSTEDYSTAEKTKLSGIAVGSEVNQNAFSNVVVGATTLAADTKMDTLTLVAGTNVTITPDAATDTITISANDTSVAFTEITAKPTTLSGYGITDAAASSHVGATGTAHGAATTAVAGFMSSTDKTKLDGVAAGAQVNAVTTVAGRTGAVVLTKDDVGLGNVDNTSDASKPVSTAQAAADASTLASAKTYADSKITALVGSAPTTLDTLQELAAQMASDQTGAAALVVTVGTKQDKIIAGTNITIAADGKTISANNTSVAFTEITGKPTTLSGYGITDGSSLAVARPTKVSATSINVNGTVLTVVSPVAGKDYFFSKTAITTTKQPDTIGGFHYGVIPASFAAVNNITQAEAEAIRGINANSIWTKWFRPICDPSGMVYVNGRWYDIYLCNVDHHINGTSAAGKTIAGGTISNGRNYPKIPLQFGGNGTVTYGSMTWFEAAEIGKAYSKDMISYDEFVAIAYGVLEASSAGAADTGITQHLANYTSKFGICMATGCQWIWSSELGRSTGATYAWKADTEGRGSLYSDENGPMSAIFGGALVDAVLSGSRASGWNLYVWHSHWSVGCRFACDHLELA